MIPHMYDVRPRYQAMATWTPQGERVPKNGPVPLSKKQAARAKKLILRRLAVREGW